jgi:hypothetical protein
MAALAVAIGALWVVHIVTNKQEMLYQNCSFIAELQYVRMFKFKAENSAAIDFI